VSDTSNGRVSLYIKVSPEYKARIERMAKARGKGIADLVVACLSEELKFFEFHNADDGTTKAEAQADWESLVADARKD
jgi:hypothetical protein